MKRLIILFLTLLSLAIGERAAAQHTLGVTGGYGYSTGRLYPTQETRSVWGCYNAGITWRHYGPQRYVGGFGIDLEWMQRGFSYAPFASVIEDKKDYKWYTRRVESLMLPIVWQPHIYLAKNHLRLYIEAAAFFCYNLSSTYDNDYARSNASAGSTAEWSGPYEFKRVRDNRWGYGLAGGGGLSYLTGRFEVGVRVRYYFGYSDLLRNRNKYAGNTTDGPENPFSMTPIRSPLDNLTINVGVAWRFGKGEFDEWERTRQKQQQKREKRKESFDFKE